jgi:LemA protein
MSFVQLMILLVALALLLAILYPAMLYNSLVALRNRVRNAFSQIEVQLKRRHDLIPSLVEMTKGYLRHESETLEAVVRARNQAVAATTAAAANPAHPGVMSALSGAEGVLNGALGRLLAVSEAYPELRSSQNMLQLGEELTSTENKVAFARQAFNDAVMHFNTRCESFPAVLLARPLGFLPAEPFELEGLDHHQTPKVDFSGARPSLPPGPGPIA